MAKIEANGMILNYEIKGEGEPVLFLHGLGASWKMWVPQILFLEKYQIILVDMRGHGGSTREFPDVLCVAFNSEIVLESLTLTLRVICGCCKISII